MKKIFLGILFLYVASFAQIKVAGIFGDHMVLQQNAPIKIWGTAQAGEHISAEMNNQKAECTTSEDGKWRIEFKPMNAGGPFQLSIQGKNLIVIKDILIGEVWLCSGQSNMEFQLKRTANAEEEISKAYIPSMRIFIVKHNVADNPQENCEGEWMVCSPKTIGDFSGVAYYFGKNLQKELKTPIGLIQSTWGGTPAEAWTAKNILESDNDFNPILVRWKKQMDGYPAALEEFNHNRDSLLKKWYADSADAVAKGMAPPRKPNKPEGPGTRNQPSGLYNGMIYPLVPLSIRGAIWYQGEANAGRAYQYRKLFPAMIKNWRELWGIGDFSFYFVQLPNFSREPEPSKSGWTELREAQLMTLALPNTGMAVTIDIGDSANLHPTNKADVGYRLSLIALDNNYNRDDIFFSGPIYDSYFIVDNQVHIKFKHTANGLIAKGNGELKGFTIASSDTKFTPAKAKIEGSEVIVWSDDIKSPASVRYAWADGPECNLYNSAMLPASPFRTDDWPEVTFYKR